MSKVIDARGFKRTDTMGAVDMIAFLGIETSHFHTLRRAGVIVPATAPSRFLVVETVRRCADLVRRHKAGDPWPALSPWQACRRVAALTVRWGWQKLAARAHRGR